MSNFKMPTAYHPSNAEWVRPIESLTSDGVRELQRLNAENDKLRELVKMMWLACKSEGIVGGIYAYPDRNSNTDERVRFEPLLQEMGIEVE